MQLDGRKLTKAEAARINGSKGRGPITARGKEIVCRNSLKHGLAAQRFTVLEGEDENEYKMLLTSVYRRVTPSGDKEEKIALRMASAVWRLRRIERWERDAEKMKLYRNIHRYETVILREYKKAVNDLAVHRASQRGRRRKPSTDSLLLPLLSIA